MSRISSHKIEKNSPMETTLLTDVPSTSVQANANHSNDSEATRPEATRPESSRTVTSRLPQGVTGGPHVVFENNVFEKNHDADSSPSIIRISDLGGKSTVENRTVVKNCDFGLEEGRLAQSRRLEVLKQSGDFTLAYNSAVQEGLEYFWGGESKPDDSDVVDPPASRAGYVAFSKRKGNIFVLGDPVVERAGLALLLKQFVAKYPHATFCQISSATAEVLQGCGFYINEMGVDTTLHLANYSFAGKAMERIRYAYNWLHRRGYRVLEADYKQIAAKEIREVSNQWRSKRSVKKREMRFLNRPIRFEDELDVRKFFLLDSDDRVVAFFYFDPLYRDGEVIGYATSIKRRHPDAPLYAEQGIMKFAVEKFKEEGRQEVKLGLSPLAWIENKTFRCNPLLHFSFRYGFQAWWVNRYFYNLQGHAAYKRHFKGVESPMHYASPVLVNDVRIASFLRLTGVY